MSAAPASLRPRPIRPRSAGIFIMVAATMAMPGYAAQLSVYPISITGSPASTIIYNPYASTPGILEAGVHTYEPNSPFFDNEIVNAALNSPLLSALPAGDPVSMYLNFADASGAAVSIGTKYIQDLSGSGTLRINDLATNGNILSADLGGGEITGVPGTGSASITLNLTNPTSDYFTPISLPGLGGPIQLVLNGSTAPVALQSNPFCVSSLSCTTPYFAGFVLDWTAAIVDSSSSTIPAGPSSVPEPQSLALFGMMLAGFAAVRAGRRLP